MVQRKSQNAVVQSVREFNKAWHFVCDHLLIAEVTCQYLRLCVVDKYQYWGRWYGWHSAAHADTWQVVVNTDADSLVTGRPGQPYLATGRFVLQRVTDCSWSMAPVVEMIATFLTVGLSMPTSVWSGKFGKPNVASQSEAGIGQSQVLSLTKSTPHCRPSNAYANGRSRAVRSNRRTSAMCLVESVTVPGSRPLKLSASGMEKLVDPRCSGLCDTVS